MIDGRLYNIDAERAILGSCLIDPNAILRVMGKLKPADFYSEPHRHIWAAMIELTRDGVPIDHLLLTDRLRAHGVLDDIGGVAYLIRLVEETPSAAFVEHYAEIVVDKAKRRRLMWATSAIAQYAVDDGATEPLAKAIGTLLSLEDNADEKLIRPGDARKRYLDLLALRRERGGIVGIPTGFVDLDAMLGGMRPGSLIVLGGRPGMGKTTLAECIADNVADGGGGVLFASLEMPVEQLLDRRIARQTGIPVASIERGYENEKVARAAKALEGRPIYYLDDSGLTTDGLLAHAFQLRAAGKVDLIVVDYLQLLNDTVDRRADETLRITYISRRLKMIARKLNVPVLALSQLNRAVEMRQDRRPTLADLRQSGAIEQDADAVILAYRESYYDPDCDHDITDLIIAKNRVLGRTGTVKLLFRRERGDFVDVAKEGEEDVPFAD
ncbi:MAG TPA: replicative DNA helicase [Caldilineae bacterium]|nr:replicative DNA helicase [Caldilineae bacterium]